MLFVDNVDKINKKFKSQPRVVMLTELSVYNLMPGKYKCKRRIEISKIGMCVVCEQVRCFVYWLYDRGSLNGVYVCTYVYVCVYVCRWS